MSQITIREITDKETWEHFVTNYSPSVVLQSWNWGQFQKSLKRKVWYLGVFDGKEQIGACLCHMIPTRLRTHLYCSNGPLLNWETGQNDAVALLTHLKTLALKNGARFVRLDPLIPDTAENNAMLARLNLKRSTTNTQAENRWILDVTPSEEDLMANMRKNTRYAIRRSHKEGVVVHSSSDSADFEKFWPLFLHTVEEQHFIPHPKGYYIKQIEAFREDKNYFIYWAEYKGKVLATALIAHYGDSAYYLHAASSNEERNTFPAHALIRKAVLDAKERGQRYFDFWGIAPTDDPKHPWTGFTFFKTGFGGFRQDVVRGYDLPISPLYHGIRLLEATRGTWGRAYFDFKRLFSR